MLFAPEINTFIKYLEARSYFQKSNTDRLRQNIFESDLNKLVFNIDFINTIEELIYQEHELKDECNLFLKNLIDNEGIVSVNTGKKLETNNADLIFEELCKFSLNNEILIGISESKEKIDSFDNVLNINNISPDNKNHILSKLIINEVCQIRHTDLIQKADIINLLNHAYSIYNKIENVIIIDRQCNLNHNLYDFLIDKSINFKYYTLKISTLDANSIKRKFTNYEIFNTNNNDLIHERVLILNNIIITMDEDPFNIVHRDTWIITIEYSEKTSRKILAEKCSLFNTTLFKSK